MKKAYPEDFKTMFGVVTMGMINTAAMYLLTGFLMMYLTDYAGIYTGVAGKAASAATALLVIARVWDAVNDPLCGWVMDRSRRGRWGKFKPYMLAGVVATALLSIMLFSIPPSFSDTAKVAYLYVVYLLLTVAYTIMPYRPITASLTESTALRSRMIGLSRIFGCIVSVVFTFFWALAEFLGGPGTPDVGLAVIIVIVPFAAVSLLGTILVKEGEVQGEAGAGTPGLSSRLGVPALKIGRLFDMFRVNKPLLVSLGAAVFGGFVWACFNAAALYYIKYAFGAENLAFYSSLYGAVLLVTVIASSALSQLIQKRISPVRGAMAAYLGAAIPLAVLWLINLAGPIRSPVLFFALVSAALLGMGAGYVPVLLLNMEAMDYNRFRLGYGLEGVVSTCSTFVDKLQGGIAVAFTGAALTWVGYDAQKYEDAAAIPEDLYRGLGTVFFGLPVIFALLCVGVYLFYPLKDRERAEMYSALK